MRNGSQSADRLPVGRSVSGSPGSLRVGRERSLSPEDLDHVFATVGQNLRDGKSSKAEKLLMDTIENYTHTAENLANLKRLLAFTFETCLLYTSDAADERSSVDLGGRHI